MVYVYTPGFIKITMLSWKTVSQRNICEPASCIREKVSKVILAPNIDPSAAIDPYTSYFGSVLYAVEFPAISIILQ
jgi:hypothetical protein